MNVFIIINYSSCLFICLNETNAVCACYKHYERKNVIYFLKNNHKLHTRQSSCRVNKINHNIFFIYYANIQRINTKYFNKKYNLMIE